MAADTGPVPPTDARTAALAGLAASAVVLAVLLAYWLWTGALDVPREGPLARYAGQFLGLYVLGAAATVGVPVALYLRYGLVAPLAVLALNAAFWGLLAEGGDAPRSFLAVAAWPGLLAAYLLLAGLEYYLRGRGPLPALPG